MLSLNGLCQEAFYYLDIYTKWVHLADSPDTSSDYTLGNWFDMDELEPIAHKVWEAIGKPEAKKCLYNCFRHGDSQTTRRFTKERNNLSTLCES